MALNTRDLWIVLRARDEASRTLRSFNTGLRDLDGQAARIAQRNVARGQSMMLIGGAITAGGIAALAVLNDMTNSAMEYTQAAAKAFTQTDNVSTSIEELKDIGKDIAREIPSAFSGMQEGLYDIFSSMDVGIGDAKMLLTEFAKVSVAGQVDLQTAEKGTIAILNAYGMQAKDVNKVNDIMFQLVRKGVGTYDEFASSIGRAVPAAVRANQSFETLAGMMAFLTRNGLSTSNAATSAARALEAMANPKTVARLDEMGVVTKDANGEFLPMVDILDQLNDRFSTMTSPERAEALQNLFKGSGGTIQASRFFSIVFTNFDEFEQRVKEMQNSAGALDEAYKIMFETPQAQMDLMNNKYEVMKTEIGDKLIPVKLKLVEVISSLLDKWNDLSPTMQSVITYGAAITAALTVLIGTMLLAGGGIMILTARFGGLGGAMTTAGGMFTKFSSPIMKVTAAAGLAATALAVVQQVAKVATKSISYSADQWDRSITKLSNSGGKVKDLDNLFTDFGSVFGSNYADGVDSLSDALDRMFNKTKMQSVNDWFDWLGHFEGFDTDLDKVKDRFSELDEALATMVSSGNAEDAEMAFAKIAQQAKDQGVPMKDLVELFPKYQDVLSGATSKQAEAADTLSKYNNLIDDNTESTDDQLKAVQDWLDMVGEQDAAFVDLSGAYDNMVQKNQDLAQAAADATDDTDDSWNDFIGKFPSTVDEYLAQLQTMVDSQSDWELNMLKLSGRVSQGTLDELARLGPEGAPLVALLVNGSDEQLQRMEDLYGEHSQGSVDNFANTLAQAAPVLTAIAGTLGQGTADELAAKLQAGTITIQDIMNQYAGIIQNPMIMQVRANTQSADQTIQQFLQQQRVLTVNVRANMTDLNGALSGTGRMGTYASGGYTGNVGVEQVAGLVHGQEFVMNADAVNRFGLPFFNALNNGNLYSPNVSNETPVVSGDTGTGVPYTDKRVYVNFEQGAIVTQEIDPTVHSTQLGTLIATKVG